MSGDTSPLHFAGELFLTLADEGRLVVDPDRADAVIADLERTLDQVRSRMRVRHIWQQTPMRRVGELPDELAHDVVEALFIDQLAPGQLELAAIELPKYIMALRRASKRADLGVREE
ncbi:hypothetical protein [Actinoplanes sp. NPDC051859]|uniref:hypothetical protein n=1 Tax=Actinoplanes sp. NPDC051859 TaxID=3363909 RepID=UPI00378E675D